MGLMGPRFGTVEFADACDARGDGRLVRVGRSEVCDGVGVFAASPVPAGTVMTAYPFVRRGLRRGTRSASRPHDADYEYEWGDAPSLDGHPALLAALPRRRRPRGCAHLVNDAIHAEVTGRDNNCDFLEDRDPRLHRPRLHLVTTRAVRRGEELLASYSLGYWLGREAALAPRNPALAAWLACHRRVRRALPHLWLREYVGAFDDAGGERLVYVASCSAKTGCPTCGAGGACPPRRVEVTFSSLGGARPGQANAQPTPAL